MPPGTDSDTVSGTDPRIRICTKMSRIPNTGHYTEIISNNT
jgi:hypothetical protein